MNRTVLVLLIIWLALAVLNIVSLFKVSLFLMIANYAFGFFNALIVIALIPEIVRNFRKPKFEDLENV